MFEFLNKSIVYSLGTHVGLGVLILTPGYLRPVHVLLGESVSHPFVSCSAASFCLSSLLPQASCEGGVHSDSPRVATPSMPGAPRSSSETHSWYPEFLSTPPYPSLRSITDYPYALLARSWVAGLPRIPLVGLLAPPFYSR